MALNLDGLKTDNLLVDDTELTAPLRSTMEQSVKENPDNRAKILDLSDKSGVDPQLVETNPTEYENNERLKGLNLDNLVKSSPGTAQYLQDFNNASVSHDDTTVMERLEAIGKKIEPFTTFGMFQRGANFVEDTYDEGKLFEGLGGTIARNFGNMLDGIKLKNLDRYEQLGDIKGGTDDPFVSALAERSQAARQQQFDEVMSSIQQREAEIQALTPEGLDTVQEGVRGGIASLAQMAPAFLLGALTRSGTTGVLGTMGGQVYADSYASARSKGLEPQEAAMYSGIQAGIEIGTELLPVKSLVAIATTPGASEITRNVVQFVVREMGTEQLATLGQSLTDYAYDLDEELAAATSPSEMLDIQLRRQAVTAISTIVAGGAQAGGAVALNRVATMMMTEEERQQAAQQTEQLQIDELAQTVEESKTKQRSPKLFKKFMQQAVNADQKDVYIDAVQAKLYLNSLDPQAIEQDPGLKLLYGKLSNNDSPNGDVTVSLGDFASEFVGSEHFDALRPHMKLSAETETPFRQEAEGQQRIDYVKTLMAKAEEQGNIYVENKRMFDETVKQLVDTGQVTEKLARYYSQLIPAYVTVKADELGVSPLDMYSQMGLTIEGPYTERRQALAEGRVLEQSYTDYNGQYPLADFNDWWGDRTFEEQGGSFNEMTPDDYLASVAPLDQNDEDTIENVQDLINHVNNGGTLDPLVIYADGKEDGRHRALAAKELGYETVPVIDYRGSPTYNQDLTDQTDTEAFKNWFGDSKVVDENGDPLVVYHGTNADFDVFDLSLAGQVGANFGEAAFFTSDPSVASGYSASWMGNEDFRKARKAEDDALERSRIAVLENGIDSPEYRRLRADATQKGGARRDAAKRVEMYEVPSDGANVVAAYLSLQDPLVIDGGGKKWYQINKKSMQQAVDGGHDGLIINNVVDSANTATQKPSSVFVVFTPEQIKSAIGNQGTFDPKNPNILRQGQSRGYYDLENVTIRLTEASDASTFLHEFAHFMLDMERRTDGKQLPAITQWWQRNASDVAKEANGYFGETFNVARQEYRGEHTAPDPEDARLDDVTKNGDVYPDDIYSDKGLQYYGTGFDQADAESMQVIRSVKNRPNASVVMYRAVPDYNKTLKNERKQILNHLNYFTKFGFLKSDAFLDEVSKPFEREFDKGNVSYNQLQENIHNYLNNRADELSDSLKVKPKINTGDWVTLSKTYAKEHGVSSLNGDYIIIQKKVKAKELFTNGDSINEFGYWKDGKKTKRFEQNELPAQNIGPISEIDVNQWVETGTTSNPVKDEAIDRATHEQFARGFEAYVMEGKAPSIELRNAFRVFARLLKAVYDAVRGGLRRPELDDGMREVFNRLLATEEQVAAEEARSRYEPLFTDAAMAGMTEEQYQKYLERNAKASDKSKETVRDKLLKQLRRSTERWWKQELADRTADKIEELSNTQIYATRDKIKSDDAYKLDRSAVKELLGVDKIPPTLRGMTITGKRGAMPDDAAAFFGYNSGAEMLNDLIKAPPIKEHAAELAEADMIAVHGDIMNDGSLESLAQDAARNEDRASIILTEIKQLSKNTGTPAIDKKTLKYLAGVQIGARSLQEIRPERYRRAEIRSAQEAAVAMSENRTEDALRAKTKQVMNMYLWRAAMDAREQGDRIVKHMARFSKKSVRERIGKAGNGYLDQILSILARFEFRKSISIKKAQENAQSIQTWFTARSEDGDNIVLSPEVMDERYGRHWKEIPMDELTGIYESVVSIEHNAKSANEINVAEETLTFEQAINRGLASMDKVKNKFSAQRTDVIDKKNPVRRFIAEQTKIPFLVSWLDGGERVGVMHDLIMNPINNAAFQEQELWSTVGKKVVEALENRDPEMRKRHAKKFFIPEIASGPTDMHTGHDGNLYGHQILAVALNTGNEGNLTKMLVGEGWADQDNVSLDNDKLQAVLKHMTKEDWDLVQLIWDQINQLYPLLADVHQRTSGLPLEAVEPTPVETPYGTYRGGYYPVKYDANRSQRAAENEAKANEQTTSMFNSAGLMIPSVSTGSRINRTEYVGPIKLSLEVTQEHLHEVIHFITHYEAVRQVYKVIKDPQITEAIKAKMGPSEYNLLKPWLNDVAKDGRASESKLQLESMLGRLRTGVTLGVMGFKASTILIQGSGIFNTMAETGPKDVMRAMRSILTSDRTIQESYDYAFENSKVLKYRTQTMDRELRNVMSKVEGKNTLWAKTQQTSMMGIALFQTYTVDVVSWYAGYMKGMRDFEGDQQRAFKYADWVVENAQGSGATKDMAAIMRNKNEAWRLFTMFMTFFSSLGNMTRDTARGAVTGRYTITSTAAKAMFMFLLPAIYEAVMRAGIPDDEEEAEELVERIVFNAAMMPIGTQPLIRDVANGAGSGFGYNASPVFATVGKGVEASGMMVNRFIDEEEITQSQIKNFSRMLGAWYGVPGVNQMWASGEYMQQLLEDGEDFSTRQLLFGPDRD